VTGRLGGPGEIDAYRIDELGLGRRIDYDVRENWKQIIENFMECYHCPVIHPELTRVLPEFTNGYATQYYVGHGAEFGAGIEGFTVDGSAGVTRLPRVRQHQDRRYYGITVRPQMFLNLVPDHVIVHRMFPLRPDRTLVRCDWLYLPEVIESGHDLARSVELFHRVNQQDFEACERCQVTMGSRAYARGGVLVPSEHHLGGLHDWLRAKIEDS
jgi:Rieske 2Fe-2S family protein